MQFVVEVFVQQLVASTDSDTGEGKDGDEGNGNRIGAGASSRFPQLPQCSQPMLASDMKSNILTNVLKRRVPLTDVRLQ
jgi:hypothetical protein